jgi:hypothetical protein
MQDCCQLLGIREFRAFPMFGEAERVLGKVDPGFSVRAQRLRAGEPGPVLRVCAVGHRVGDAFLR